MIYLNLLQLPHITKMKSLILLLLASIQDSICRDCNCGKIQDPGQYYRIHRGFETDRWKHPWQILIQLLIYDQSDIQTKDYGGVLISKKHIVTCAKCLQDFYEEKLSWTLVMHCGFQKVSRFFILQHWEKLQNLTIKRQLLRTVRNLVPRKFDDF